MTGLPRLLVLTERRQARGGLVPTVAGAVAGGARAVLLRERDLDPAVREGLARSLVALLEPVGGVLLLAGADVGMALSVGATGVHLAAADPWPDGREGLWVGRSCHSAAELARASGEGADWATVSPVFTTPSKPGYGPALGPEGLAELVAGASVPVFALGGVTAETAGACLSAGAAGVAVMGAVMGADDPARAVAALVAATSVWAPR